MDFQSYNVYKSIFVPKGCAGFMVTNIGDTKATINNMLLNPDPRNVITPTETFRGDSITIMLHKGDIYSGKIDLAFDMVAPGTNPRVEVVQLFYTDNY